jgi:hypothetical protein
MKLDDGLDDMKTPIEDELLLLDFATRFLGYGSLTAPIWVVGPEAGGGASIDEVHNRAIVWITRGRREIEDLQGYHKALKLPPKCDWEKNEQKTWAALIRIIFAIENKVPGPKDVLRFQIEAFGKADGDYCALDVSQISCPNEKDWQLGPTGISWLQTKKTYKALIFGSRCKLLRSRMSSSKPRLAVFYGISEEAKALWRNIVEVENVWKRLLLPASCQILWPRGEPQLSWTRNEHTLFIMMPHPNGIRPSGQGACNQFYAGLGQKIRTHLSLDE